MNLAEVRKITLKEAVEKIDASCQHAKRIRQAIRGKGIKELIHGNVGRPSMRRGLSASAGGVLFGMSVSSLLGRLRILL